VPWPDVWGSAAAVVAAGITKAELWSVMTSEEEKLILKWHSSLSNDVKITLVFSEERRSELFQGFCEELTNLSPKITVTERKGDEADTSPALEIHEGLIYHAIPLGPELASFLNVLSGLAAGSNSSDGEIESRLQDLKIPCFLKLFIAPDCPFCPKMVQDLAPLTLGNEWVTLTIIDGLLFPEMAEPHGIKSAPTLLLDDRLRWTGLTPLDEILEVMLDQDPSLLSAASLEALLGDGRADLVAKMMMENGKLFPAFLDMLVHEKWPVRLGAMVAMEEIIERDKSLAEQCVEPLWERIPGLNEQVRGDVIYILGEAGTAEMIPRLEAVLGDVTDVETREAVTEAIETISKRM
jgi:hypothetical protein